MIKLRVNGQDYNLKFGYKSFKRSGILKEVLEMQNAMNAPDDEFDNIAALDQVFEITSKLVLAALQKNHEEFRTDYGNNQSVEECIEKVDDLLDDYMDEEDCMPIMELFHTLAEELFENGFLFEKSEKLENALTEQDATIVPTDHMKAEN